MKRYWLFFGMTYYPYGGMSDFKESFESLDHALNTQTESYEWAQIFDSKENCVIFEKSGNEPWSENVIKLQ